jgi:hypothetical protein
VTTVSKPWIVPAAALTLAACAASPAPSRPAPRGEDVVRSANPGTTFSMEMRLNHTDATMLDTVAAAPDRAWAELPAVFQALALPINAADPRDHRLSTIGFKPYRIEKQPLSRYLDCGRGIMAGEYADSYEVVLSVDARLVPARYDPARTVLESTVAADARPRAEAGNPVHCQSKGTLEHRLHDLLAQRLSSPAGG